MSVLLWIQTIWHSDSVCEFLDTKLIFLKVSSQQQKHEKLFPACRANVDKDFNSMNPDQLA